MFCSKKITPANDLKSYQYAARNFHFNYLYLIKKNMNAGAARPTQT